MNENGPKLITKMGQMDQNRWAECAKIDQNDRNAMGWRELGHQNDPNGPKWIFKMSQMHLVNRQNESNAPKSMVRTCQNQRK